MAKLKITERKVTEKETDIDLPIYLYTQDEYCNDIYKKWDGKTQIVLEYFWFGFKIERSNSKLYIEDYQLRNLCTESQFNEAYEEALNNLKL